MRQITIQDVAKKAGVSLSTISKVINNYPDVKDETRVKVLNIIKELNYVPNISARLLPRSQDKQHARKSCIAIVVPEQLGEDIFSYSPTNFFYQIISGIINEARELKLSVYTEFVRSEYRQIIDTPRIIQEELVDGIIIAGNLPGGFMEEVINRKIKIVYASGFSNETHIDAVVMDNLQGSYDAVKYLIDKGHREIGILTGWEEGNDSKERLMGAKKAFSDNGIEFKEEYVATGWMKFEGGQEAAETLLNRGKLPTAIFAMNDLSALGAKTMFEKRGLKVPGDISIVGFDDIPAASQATPALTTIRVYMNEIGKLAVERLNKLIENEDLRPLKILSSTKLIERESVREI